jgi:hypothetical protein
MASSVFNYNQGTPQHEKQVVSFCGVVAYPLYKAKPKRATALFELFRTGYDTLHQWYGER